MTNKKTTRRAFVSSIISLMLCIVMLVGTTFAWFTDTVETVQNNIVAGNLDIELSYWNRDNGSYEPVDSTTELFSKDSRWEPGHVEVVQLLLENVGTLSLKYDFSINVVDEKGSINVYDDYFELSDYIEYAVISSDTEIEHYYSGPEFEAENRAAAVTAAQAAGTAKISAMKNNAINYSSDLKSEKQKYVTLIVFMPENVTNEANYKTGEDAPKITLGVNLYATQAVDETDSFGSEYDKDAKYSANYSLTSAPVQVNTKNQLEVPITVTSEVDDTKAVSQVSATVPEGAKVEEGTTELVVTVTENTEEHGVAVSDDQGAIPLLIDVEGLDEANTKVVEVTVNIGAGRTGIAVNHDGTAMKAYTAKPASGAGKHNYFFYDAATGELTIYSKTFSPFTITHDVEPVVTTEAELAEAIAAGGYVKLGNQIEITKTIQINGSVAIDLNGKGIDASAVASRPFEMANDATLIINGEGSKNTVGGYGLVNVPSGTTASITLNGGTYTGETDNGAFIKLRKGDGNVSISLNNVSYTDKSDDGFVLNKQGYTGDLTVNINGGNYKAAYGFAIGGNSTVTGATIETKKTAFEVHNNVTFENCNIKVKGGEYSDAAPNSAIAVSSNGIANVNNCVISSDHYAFCVYSSGGSIYTTNTEYAGKLLCTYDRNTYPECKDLISIDGVAMVDCANALKDALAVSDSIKLISDITLTDGESIVIPEGTAMNIDLNGYTLTNPVKAAAALINNGDLVISNGTIVNENIEAQGAAAIINFGTLVLDQCNAGSDLNRGAAVQNKGGKVTVNGGFFATMDRAHSSNGYAYVFINNGGSMTINNAEVNGRPNGIFYTSEGTIKVNDGSYVINEGANTWYVGYAAENATVYLNGGNYGYKVGSGQIWTGEIGATYGNVVISDNCTINWER